MGERDIKKIYCNGSLKKPIGEKEWVEVYFEDETFFWVPKLKDIAEMLQLIGKCEDEKYGETDENGIYIPREGRGASYLAEAIKKAILGKPLEEIVFTKEDQEKLVGVAEKELV